ncbi:uncharacterized protein LOC125490070 [Plutella xylostella]|uniref:uncharacterized protein LOC125490070 n=1 Tax=Plutella xylostella TaxID=51655 RepID=UPI002032DD22|nr:uncharacterized protein LOC125490070 [Plutella xylostella]
MITRSRAKDSVCDQAQNPDMEITQPSVGTSRENAALRGAAKECTATLLATTLNPQEVINALEQRFARPEIIVNQQVTCLKMSPKLTYDLKDLPNLVTKLQNCVATLRALDQHDYLISPELYQTVLTKLTPILLEKWFDYAHSRNSNKKLVALSDFLEIELVKHVKFGSLASYNPILPQDQIRFKGASHRREENVLATTSNAKKTQCVYCNNKHDIRECTPFSELPINDKWAWVTRYRVCYRCLKSHPHTWRECSPNLKCGVDSCSRNHDPMLHRQETSGQIANNTVNVTCPQPLPATVDEPSNNTVVDTINTAINTSCERRQTLLKIIPVTISGPKGSYDTFAMLDDGSTATVIDQAEGRPEQISVQGIGGMRIDVQVEYVSFDIRGKYANDSYKINNAKSMEKLNLLTTRS